MIEMFGLEQPLGLLLLARSELDFNESAGKSL